MARGIEGSLLGGRYRVGRVIGRGGLSVVREADDLKLFRRVAIKLVRGGQSREQSERLFRESRAAARADHPAVVTVFDCGSDEETGFDFLVMELLEGEDLGARLAREHRIEVAAAIQLGIEIADALTRVHAAGVVHRDLKPSNIFLARRGLRIDEVKLLDFGVAKQADHETLTATGQTVGTVAYMAPEQLSGAAHRVDARTDLYALGAVLFEAVTGRLPHPNRTFEDVARRVLETSTPPLDWSGVAVPDRFAQILERCLRRSANERFADARALCLALQEGRSDP